LAELLPLVYDQLKTIAGRYMRNERPGHTLAPTALVHEVYLRLVGADVDWQNRAHFLAVAAGLMRRILVDHAKERSRQKRGGAVERVPFTESLMVSAESDPRILAMDEALDRLAQIDARKARIVELVIFGGLTQEEAAEALGLSVSKLHREFQFAKAWMTKEVGTAG
jgi:RNA polymerase sigma factor (TIGR02999 family)